jgi:hypothetical protein
MQKKHIVVFPWHHFNNDYTADSNTRRNILLMYFRGNAFNTDKQHVGEQYWANALLLNKLSYNRKITQVQSELDEIVWYDTKGDQYTRHICQVPTQFDLSIISQQHILPFDITVDHLVGV